MCASWLRARSTCSRPRGRSGERLLQPRQPPLRSLAEPRLQPPPLLVGGDEQTPPRRGQLGHLRRAPRPAARRSTPRAASPRRHRLDERGVAEDGLVVHEHRVAAARRARRASRSARSPVREDDGSASVVEVGARLRRPVAELERRVAEARGRAGRAASPTSSRRARRRDRPRPARPARAAARRGRRRSRPARPRRRAAPGRRRRRTARRGAPPRRRRARRRAPTAAWRAVSRSRLARPAATTYPRAATATSAVASTIVATSLRQTRRHDAVA